MSGQNSKNDVGMVTKVWRQDSTKFVVTYVVKLRQILEIACMYKLYVHVRMCEFYTIGIEVLCDDIHVYTCTCMCTLYIGLLLSILYTAISTIVHLRSVVWK